MIRFIITLLVIRIHLLDIFFNILKSIIDYLNKKMNN